LWIRWVLSRRAVSCRSNDLLVSQVRPRRRDVGQGAAHDRYWVLADDKGREAARLSNAQVAVKDEALQIDGFVKFDKQQYQSERWLVVFDKAHAK
jgi:hypothetical protein